jgi:hypothetical protein
VGGGELDVAVGTGEVEAAVAAEGGNGPEGPVLDHDTGVRHDLRHTYATITLSSDPHAKVVAQRLGHSTIGITLDTYSHVMPALEEETAACGPGHRRRHALSSV